MQQPTPRKHSIGLDLQACIGDKSRKVQLHSNIPCCICKSGVCVHVLAVHMCPQNFGNLRLNMQHGDLKSGGLFKSTNSCNLGTMATQ